MSLNASSINIVQWYGLSLHSCGYCKGNESISHGFIAHRLQPQTYQDLIDRGWRRSGTYCYKPVMKRTCCPMYTIRNTASNFVLSKSQKRVLKRFNKYLSDGLLAASSNQSSDVCFEIHNERVEMSQPVDLKNMKLDMEQLTEMCKDNTANVTAPEASTSTFLPTSSFGKIIGADPTKPPCKKAKLLRLERKKLKLMQQGKFFEKQDSNALKPFEYFFEEESKQTKHKLIIKTILSEDLSLDQLTEEHVVYAKYQQVIHNDPPNKCKIKDFTRFLVDTPICEKDLSNNPIIDKYGSYHQQYWIDSKLIAVGVIDILPNCISSVYFFYDPFYRDLTLGTYAALREIAFVKSLCIHIPDLKYYYMGYYMHSCPKMRYKGQYKPSELACPETYKWQPIEKCRPKLDKERYSRLDDDNEAVDNNQCEREDIEEIKIFMSNSTYVSARYSGKFTSNRETFELIGQVVGKKSLSNMLFFISDL